MFDLGIKAQVNKPMNVGANIGPNSIQGITKKPYAMADVDSIKNFKEGQNFIGCFSSSTKEKSKSPTYQPQSSVRNQYGKNKVDKMMSQQEKFMLNKISNQQNENDCLAANVIQTKPNGHILKIKNLEAAQLMATPNIFECKKDMASNTNCTTGGKVERGVLTTLNKNSRRQATKDNLCGSKNTPNMRIRRSSSKKSRDKKKKHFGVTGETTTGKNKSLRLTHSNDSRDRGLPIRNVRNTEEADQKKASRWGNQKTGSAQHHAKYKNLSSQIEISHKKEPEKPIWDKRFIESSNKSQNYDLIPTPDAAYLKRILENEKDDR